MMICYLEASILRRCFQLLQNLLNWWQWHAIPGGSATTLSAIQDLLCM